MHREYRIQHIDSVVSLALEGNSDATVHKEDFITQSWMRCVNQYRLDPTRPCEAIVLPSAEVREHREEIEQFLRIARFGIEQLYRQVAGMGYVVLLADKYGITIDYISDDRHAKELRQAGLYLGSDWNEAHAGTCGVGTAIVTDRAFTCHQTDHFNATHINLTCTSAPLHDPFGNLLGVLDISALYSPEPKSSQYMALELVKVYAQKIENANFLDCFRYHWIMRLNDSPEFVEIDPQYLLAFDNNGNIAGFNRRMQQLLEQIGQVGSIYPKDLIGCSIEDFFQCRIDDLARLMTADEDRGRVLLTQHTQQLLFTSVLPPKASKKPVLSTQFSNTAGGQPPVPQRLRELSGGDPVMERNIARAARLVDASVSILITGQTGTGKEYFAKALHDTSLRAAKAFVAVNCAALPETLIESELFGYAGGAFTGAHSKGKRGLILEADGGTLFLDEIGDMPLELQARLLRVLAQREVLPVGANKPVAVNLYVVAATHRDLKAMVAEGAFRVDLYYRLSGFIVELPALRQRSDIRFIIDKILREECYHHGRSIRLDQAALAFLTHYRWPGNIRELRNTLQFSAAVCNDDIITSADLPDHLQSESRPSDTTQATSIAHEELPDAARQLLNMLQRHQWNITAVAKELGTARITVYRWMKKYGIIPPNRRM